jgi:PAS domain S-box-containing protein
LKYFCARLAVMALTRHVVETALDITMSREEKTGMQPAQSASCAPQAAGSGVVREGADASRERERQQVNESLGESQARLEGIVNSAMDAIITVDSEQRILLFNRAAEKMFRCPASEAIGQTLDRFIPARFRTSHADHIRAFGRTGVSIRAMAGARAVYGLRADGEEFPIEASISQVEAGGQKLYTVIMRDVTERDRAEKQFRQVIEGAPNGMVMVDGEGKIVLVNAQIEKSFGYTRDELLGQPIEMLVPERFRAHHPAYRDGFIAHPTARPMGSGRDLYGLRKDGSEFPVEIGLNPIETEQGMMVLGTIVDITERKRIEETLRASETRFSIAFNASPISSVIATLAEGRYVAVNDTFLSLTGHTREEVIGRTSADLGVWLTPEARAEVVQLLKEQGQVRNHEMRYRVKDGEVRVFLTSAEIIELDGQPHLITASVDITERKRADNELRKSREQLVGVIGSAMDAIISVDEEQRIVLFNTAAERMFLYPSEEAIGQPLDRFIPKRFRPAHHEHVENFGRTHVTKRSMGTLGALFGLRSDGEEFPIEASISQLESEGRKVYTVILRDITERKHAEEALKEQARILDLAPVLIRDLTGRIIFWNKGSEQMYGWSSEEAVGQLTHTLLRTEFPRPLEEIKAKLFAYGHWEGELVKTRRDGERIVVASQWVLHKNEHDEPRAILEVNNNITERKQAEEEVRRLNEELEQRVQERTSQLEAANKELEAFSYSVSHDLRAPLRHINGFSQALLEDYADKLDKDGKFYLQEVRGASQEMAQLIDDVLQLARVTRSEMRREVVNLSELAQSVIAELRKRDAGRQVSVHVEEELSTHGDKRLLRIVLSNLLSNAWKFTLKRAQPEIVSGHEQRDGETVYFVRDNGAGFDMAFADKLFGAFQRLHTADEFEGTGIGLATVQRIINRHGGRVWAEGAVNQGATFYFTLPDFKGERT